MRQKKYLKFNNPTEHHIKPLFSLNLTKFNLAWLAHNAFHVVPQPSQNKVGM